MLWLKMRFGVYFPWKVYVELVPSGSWADKGRARGKRFTRQARAFFPRAVAWIEQLPFTGIGRCTILGLEANDHGTVHHDGDPQRPREPAHFVDALPAGRQAPLLWDEETCDQDSPYASRVYWFNDQDDHGVDADPFFRYSIRVDGVFEPDFLARLRVGTGWPRARHANVSDLPLRRDAFVDEPGLVGARWWQDSVVDPIGRRKTILTLLAVGVGLGVAGLAIEAVQPTKTGRRGALALQREYGWSFGAASENLVFNGQSTEPFDRERLARMAAELAPRAAAHRPFFVQTLFESPTALPRAVSSSDPAPIQPLQAALVPIFTAAMREAYLSALAVAATLASPGTAVVVDLDGPSAVAFAAGASDALDPVFLFDNWPHPRGVVPAHLTLAAAAYYQPMLAKAQQGGKPNAPPMFVLDRQRLAPYTDDAAHFDNRWVAHLPGVAALETLGVQRIFYVMPQALKPPELDDLNDDLVADHAAGIAIFTLDRSGIDATRTATWPLGRRLRAGAAPHVVLERRRTRRRRADDARAVRQRAGGPEPRRRRAPRRGLEPQRIVEPRVERRLKRAPRRLHRRGLRAHGRRAVDARRAAPVRLAYARAPLTRRGVAASRGRGRRDPALPRRRRARLLGVLRGGVPREGDVRRLVPAPARSCRPAASAVGASGVPRGRARATSRSRSCTCSPTGSPSDLEVRRACAIADDDLWKKRTFRRLLGAVRTLSFASVKGDAMYMTPRDHDWGLTASDLEAEKYAYLRMLAPDLRVPQSGHRPARISANTSAVSGTYVRVASCRTNSGSSIADGSNPCFCRSTLRSLNVPVRSASV